MLASAEESAPIGKDVHGDSEFWYKIIMSDETHIRLKSMVNKEICCF